MNLFCLRSTKLSVYWNKLFKCHNFIYFASVACYLLFSHISIALFLRDISWNRYYVHLLYTITYSVCCKDPRILRNWLCALSNTWQLQILHWYASIMLEFFGYNSSPHSPALHWCPCRLPINITMHNCSSASVQETDRTDKQILMKFDIGEFYEKLLSHFNLKLD